ncbi:MAG: hypothetical protein ACLT1W_14280 [Alistipes onderdonkii]
MRSKKCSTVMRATGSGTDRFAEVNATTTVVRRFSTIRRCCSPSPALYDKVAAARQLTEATDRRYDRLVITENCFRRSSCRNISPPGPPNRWIDMRRCLVTDDAYREAEVDTAVAALLRKR